jgi:capsular exopolysaccharide synthesis family protein
MLNPFKLTDEGGAFVGDRADSAPNAPEQMPILLYYWYLFLRRKWLIAGIIAAAFVLGLIVTLLTTPLYTATARVDISREAANVTNVEGLESTDTGVDLEFYQTQYSLLKARSLAERVASKLNLATNDEFFRSHGEDIAGGPLTSFEGSAAVSGRDLQERRSRAVDLLLEHVIISPIRGSSLVDVSYTIGSPKLAAQIANTWVDQFIRSSMDRRYQSTEQARQFLNDRLNDLRKRLEESERNLVNYAGQKNIVTLRTSEDAKGGTRTERTLVSQDLESLNDALTQATADRIAAQSALSAALETGVSGNDLTNAAIAELRQRRAEAQADYAKLLVQFEPEYPAARALKEQIDALDRSIAREESRDRTGLRGEYRKALQRENSLRAQVDAVKSELRSQEQSRIQYNIFQREVDTNRQLYDSILQRFKEIGVAGIGANNISIVDLANTPEVPSSPKLLVNLILSLLAGGIVALAVVILLDQVDEGVRQPSTVGQRLGIPLLGAVNDVGDEDEMDLLADRKSSLSDAYLTICTNLGFSTDHGVAKSLMLTSTREKEGKTTSSIALATVLSRTRGSCVLVDADMRSPAVFEAFGLENDFGLSNLLSGDADIDRALRKTTSESLSLIGAGPVPPNAAELLSGHRMQAIVAELSRRFDYIVVDAPPLLGLADAPLIARTVEGVVFVIEAERIPLRSAQTALERVRAGNGRIFGAILTKYDTKSEGYGEGYGYGYGFEYGKEKDA